MNNSSGSSIAKQFAENFSALYYYRRIERVWHLLPPASSFPQVNEFHATHLGETYYYIKAYSGSGPRWIPTYPIHLREGLKRMKIIGRA